MYVYVGEGGAGGELKERERDDSSMTLKLLGLHARFNSSSYNNY